MIVAGGLNFGGPGNSASGPVRHVVRLRRHAQPRERPALDQARRRVPALPQRELRRRHRRRSTSRAWRRSWPERRTRSASRSASDGVTSTSAPWRCSFRTASPSDRQPHARARPALRVARHADRAGRPVRRLRRGERVAAARRRRRRRDLPAEQPELRAARRRGLGRRRRTAAPCVRAAYGWAVDEPGTTAVRDTAGNPPFATPLTAAGSIPLASAIDDDAARRARAGDGRSRVPERLAAVVERERAAAARAAIWPRRSGTSARAAGTCGSRATSISRSTASARSPRCRPSSPILPGAPLGNITQVESSGFSSYTRCGCRSRSGCRAACSSTRRTPGRSRSTPIRSIRPASPSRTATTSPTSTACRTSTPVTGSCSARRLRAAVHGARR